MKKKKRFLDTELWKYIRTVLELLLIAAMIWAAVAFYNWIGSAHADELDENESELEIAYVICTKGDHVNIRPFPGKKHEPSGWLDPGDMVYLDGKEKDGYCHAVGLSNEEGKGWIHKGYLVFYPPEFVDRDATVVSNGRLAARKYVNGKRTRWLKPGSSVHVWYMSEEWCVTNRGYVQAKYLELDGE
jgi:hypothetical protein